MATFAVSKARTRRELRGNSSVPRTSVGQTRTGDRPCPDDRAAAGRANPFRKAWTALVAEVNACQKCALGRTRTLPAVYRGAPNPRVLFVGESPGAEEDRQGVPFVGRSGKRLDRALEQLGLEPSEVGFLNLIKCHPPENRFSQAAADACRPYLERQLEILDPKCLVTLGAQALHAFSPSSGSITAIAGRPIRTDGRTVFPLLHPAAMLHDPRLASRWTADVCALRQFLSDGPHQKV